MLKHYSKEFWKLFFIATTIMLGLAYYQGTVVLYLLKQFHFTEKNTYEIYGVFAAAAYLCTFVTGWITKKWLQPNISIMLGLFLYTLGTFLSAFANADIYLWALAFIALGYGLIYIK
jgi:dipeptide/tripeptide permease